MSQAVQPQVGGIAVSTANPLPVTMVNAGATSSQSAKLNFSTFTSAAGAQTLSIPAGALEVSLANTGASAATFSTASMAPATTALKPVTDPDGATLNFVAPSGYTLEAMTVVAPVGVTIDYMVIKP